MHDPMWDIAREVTDEVLGAGAYAQANEGNRDPLVQEQVAKSRAGSTGLKEKAQFLLDQIAEEEKMERNIPNDAAWSLIEMAESLAKEVINA